MLHHLRSTKVLSVLLLPILINACAMFETGEAKLKRVRTISIISAMGDELSFTRSGLNGMDNRSQHYSIKSWKLDDAIVKQAGALIATHFQVQPIAYDPELFYSHSGKDSPITPLNLIRDDPLKQLLRTQAQQQSPDAYVVIVKAESTIGPSNRTVEGAGVVKYNALFGSCVQIHALYEIRVYDGHTLDLLEKRPAAPLDNASVTKLAGPSRIVDESYMPSAGDPAQNEKLQAAIVSLIERSLQPTLGDLHLADLQ